MQTLQFIGKTQRPTDTNRQKGKKTKRLKRQRDRRCRNINRVVCWKDTQTEKFS